MKTLLVWILGTFLCAPFLFGISGQHAPAQWIEVKSPHFRVLTDANEKRGRELAEQFEQMRAVFAELLLNGKEIQSPLVQIVAMEDEKRLIEYALRMDQDQPFAGNVLDSGNLITEADNEPPGVEPGPESGLKTVIKYAVKGVYLHHQDVDYILLNLKMLNRQPTPLRRTRVGREVVLHEYAHRLIENNFPPLPRWFEEGFAVYFSTIKIQKDQLILGDSAQAISNTSRDQFIPVATLFSSAYLAAHARHSDSEESAFYAESRRIVDYLLTYHKMDQAQKYFQLVRRQTSVPEAIKQAFNMTPDEFDAAIKNLPEGPKKALADSSSGATVLSAPHVDVPITVAPLNDLAVETILADVHLHEPGYHAIAVKEFEAILAKEPRSTGAQRGLGLDSLRHRNLDAAEKYFRKAIEGDPKNWLGHYYLALVLQQRADPYKVKDLEQEARQVTELNPTFADGFAILAATLATEQKTAEAEAAYQNAIRLNPSNETYAGNLGIIYMAQSRFDEAKTIFAGLEGSQDRKISGLAKTYLQALAVREKRSN
ncbi:MAG TPA: tetratricopeptide repeat protein [Candidatus Angelobacter sp.]|jgi:tetratricopeptide (TPR) repeat protein|nr:tetratricopeptide repeat protein [Candidatus Angelobacter sp.]